MSKLKAVTPPVWILILTLVAIVATGALFGKSSRERTAYGCESLAIEAHPNHATAQKAYLARCLAQPSVSGKSMALVLLSILMLGVGLYSVWWRQRNSGGMSLPRTSASPPESALAVTDSLAKTAPPATTPSVSPGSTLSASPRATEDKGAAAESPDASGAGAVAMGDGLSAAHRQLCVDALQAKEEPSKEEVAGNLGHFLGTSDTQLYKPAPLDDLELLAKCLAVAALAGPEGSRYRRAFQMPPRDFADRDLEALQAKTKKALHTLCVETLRQDLGAIAKRSSFPASLSSASVVATADALHAEGALAGLSRCSKAALVHLAAFLRD